MAATIEISKTYQYRKVMKPMLERKRRARINKCLDELKDLMVATLESEGEHVTRLEKADILELTVSHLMKVKQQKRMTGNICLSQSEAFRSGYIYASNEVSRSLARIPGVNVSLGTQLMTHLGQRLNQMHPLIKVSPSVMDALTVHCESVYTSASSPYSIPLSPILSFSGSPTMDSVQHTYLSRNDVQAEEYVWRPWQSN